MNSEVLELSVQNVLSNLKENISIDKLILKYGINWKTLYNLICPSLNCSCKNISAETVDRMIKLYEVDKLSCTKIGALTGYHHKAVSKILKENSISVVGNGRRKYSLNEHYFDKIDTPNKAYILGFLYADGYNEESKSTICLSLQESDKEILERIRIELNSEKELDYILQEQRISSNGYHYNNMYKLILYSTHMSKMLANWGVVKNKSLILEYPNFLCNNLESHFIRGYFDGDGSFCHRLSEKYGRRDLITFTSTENFCCSLLNRLHVHHVISGGGIYDASCHNGITKVLSVSGVNQTKRLLDWLYADAELYLKRKHDLYVKTFYNG